MGRLRRFVTCVVVLVLCALGLPAVAVAAPHPAGHGLPIQPPGDSGWKPAAPAKNSTFSWSRPKAKATTHVVRTDPHAKVVGELSGRRTANASFYRLSDGRMREVLSADPVHYRDAKGAWRPIDTRVKPVAHGKYSLGVEGNAFHTYFSSTTAGMMRVEQGSAFVQMAPDAAGAGSPVVSGDSVTYPGALGGADLTYQVDAQGVKEGVVLHRRSEVASVYSFTLTVHGFTPRQRSNGSIAFYGTEDSSQAAFVIPAPVMTDSAPDADSPYGLGYSSKVAQSMSWDAARSTLRVTERPDVSWLRAKARRFPVTIDPTIVVAPTPTEAANVMIEQDTPTTNFATNWRLSVGTTSAAAVRALLKFPLPSVPAGTTITSASLNLYYDQTFTTDANNVALEAHAATAAWDPTTATWSNAGGITGVLAGSTTKQAGVSNVWNSFPVTSVVQGWLNGTLANNGFVVKAQNEALLGQGGPRYEGSIFAFGGETANRPQLVITYGVPGVAVNPPTVIHSTGAELSWPAYTNTSGNPANNLVEYQVHRAVFQTFTPSASTEVSPVTAGTTSFVDSTAQPTPTSSADPFGNAYYYMVVVKTASGALIPGPTQLVRLPKAGLTTVIMQPGSATTLSSAQPNTVLNTLSDSGLQKPWLEVGDNSSTFDNTRAVFDFGALPSTIPATATVMDAYLRLWHFDTTTGTAGAVYELHGLTRAFTAGQATWNNATSTTAWTTPGGDFSATPDGTVSSLTNDPNRQTLDATAIVQGWVNTPASNHGLEVKLANEAGAQERSLFAGPNTAEPALAPGLVVTYLDPTSENTYYAPATPTKAVPGTTYTVPVTVNNTTASMWPAASEKLTYHWVQPDGTDVTNSANQLTTALPADLPPGAQATVNAQVTPPTPTTNNAKDQYTLAWDMVNTTTGTYLSATAGGVGSLKQATGVEQPGSNQLGLESFYQYTTVATGSGSALYTNASSGNTVWNDNLFANPSRGFNTFLRLSYNSLDTTDTTTGFGWSIQASTPTRLGQALDFHPNPHPTEVTMDDGDGTSHVWTWNATTSTWTSPPGVHLYLQELATCGPQTTNSRAWSMTRPDGSVFYYDCEGYPTAMVDLNGNESDFTYSDRKSENKPEEFLSEITDPSGRQTLTVNYYTKGSNYSFIDSTGTLQAGTKLTNPSIIDHVSSIKDISGRTVDFYYTTQGLLGRVVDGAGTSLAKTFNFTYDAAQGMKNVKLVGVQDPRGNTTSLSYYDPPTDPKFHWWTQNITDRLGKTASFAYAEPGVIPDAATQTTVTDANSHAYTYQIDATGRMLQSVNPLNQQTTLTWDTDNNVASLTEANGAVTTYTYDPNTGYPLSMKDAVANKNGTAATTFGYQTALSGHVAFVTDKVSAAGRHYHFTYDPKGNLLTVQTPNGVAAGSGFTTTYTYDSLGELLTTTDANNHTTTYSDYDPSGYPDTTTDPLDNVTSTTYGPRGEVLSTTDPLGHTSTRNWDVFLRPLDSKTPKDQANNVYLTTPAPVYDANDNVVQSTTPNGAVSTATFDADDGVTTTTLPPDTPTSPARITTYTYDAVGNQLTVTQPDGNLSGAAPGSFTTTNTYDADNQLVTSVDAEGNKTTTSYDDVGNPATMTDPVKNATAGNTAFTTKTDYDLDHRPTTVTDAAGKATSTVYDADGLKTSTTDQNGNTTLFSYDRDGNLTQQQVPVTGSGSTTSYDTTQYTYDQVGNQTSVISPRGVASGITDAYTTKTSYDADNRKSAVFGARNPDDPTYNVAAETDYTYDAAGRVTKVTAPPSGGQSVRPATTSTFWDNGWPRSSTDPWGITTSYDYDPLGDQTSRTITSAGGSSSRTQSWTYYPDGTVATRTDAGIPVGLQVEMVDNSDSQNTSASGTWTASNTGAGYVGYNYQTHAAGAGSDAFTWNLDIPEDGSYAVYVQYPAVTGAATNASYTITDSTGTATATVDQTQNAGTWVSLGSYTFSAANTTQQVSLAQNSGGSVTADAIKVVRDNSGDTQPSPNSFAYTYDANGSLTNLVDNSPGAQFDAYNYTYNQTGLLKQLQEELNGTVKHTTTYNYNPDSQLSSEAHDATSATYTYDTRNLLATVLNKETSADPGKTTRYSYTAAQQIETEAKANGNVVTFTYNENNSVATQVEKTAGGTLVASHTLSYDQNGNQTQDVSTVQSADDNTTDLDNTATDTYTPSDKIATVTNSDGKDNQTYTYDLSGNVTAQTVGGVATTNVYDRDRLLSATAGGATADYNYDPFGRTDTVTSAGAVQQRYTYDGFDHVTSEQKLTASGLTTTDYTYDALDRPLTQTDNAGSPSAKTTTFDYLATSSSVADEQVNGSVSKVYQYNPNGERLDQIVHNSDGTETPTYYTYNPHTDVQAITDGDGNTKSTYDYTAYGTDDTSQDTGIDKGTGGGNTGTTSTTDPYNVYRFNHDRIDATTGNYNMGFRNYDPTTNRFLSRDMYNGAFADMNMTTDPYTGNRYAFGSGNPLSNVEINGHFSIGNIIDDIGDAIGTAAEDVGGALETAADGLVDLGTAGVAIPGLIFLNGIGWNTPTAPSGTYSKPGATPDFSKGLLVQQHSKQEWRPVDQLMPDEVDFSNCKQGGPSVVYYQPLDSQGRAQGVMACLNKSGFNYTMPNGSLAKSGIPDTQIVGSVPPFPPFKPGYAESKPKGWELESGFERGHLLARQLGGVGDDRRNLVPLYPSANDPGMKDYEDEIADAINAGQTIYFSARANYDGDNPVPASVTMTAITASGAPLVSATVLNEK